LLQHGDPKGENGKFRSFRPNPLRKANQCGTKINGFFLKGKNEGGTQGETLDLGHGKWGKLQAM